MRASNVFILLVVLGMVPVQPGKVWALTRVDLRVENVSVSTSGTGENQKVEIVPSIRNNGSEAAGNISIQADIKKDGKRVKAIKDIPMLSRLPHGGVGQGVPLSVPGLKPGSYQLTIKVDPDNKIPETNESNNEKTISFTISSVPLSSAY